MTRLPILLTLCVFGVGAGPSLLAQNPPPADPLIGTWKLNPAETRASAGAPLTPPSQRTETYRLTSAHDIELVLSTTAADGAPSTSTVVFSARGGVVRQTGTPAGPMLVETRLSPREWIVTYLANGTQLMTMRKVVSEDGKTMRQTASGLNAAGQPWEGLLVFERQP